MFERTRYFADAHRFDTAEQCAAFIEASFEWAKSQDYLCEPATCYVGPGKVHVAEVWDFAGIVRLGYIEAFDDSEEE